MRKIMFVVLVLTIAYFTSGCAYLHMRLDAGALGGDATYNEVFGDASQGNVVKRVVIKRTHTRSSEPASAESKAVIKEGEEDCGCPE